MSFRRGLSIISRKTWKSQAVRTVVSWAVSAVFIWLVDRNLTEFDWRQLAGYLISPWFLIALLLMLISIFVKSQRWRIILSGHANGMQTLKSIFIGQWFSLLNTSAYDVVRPIHLAVSVKRPLFFIFGSSFIERMYDFLFIFLVLSAYLLLTGNMDAILITALSVLFAFFLISFAAVFFSGKLYRILLMLVAKTGFELPLLFKDKASDFIKGTGLHRSVTMNLKAGLLSVITWTLIFLSNWVLVFDLPLPDAAKTFTASLIINCYYIISFSVPGMLAGAGIANFAVVVAVKSICVANGIEINPELEGIIVLYSVMMYLVNLSISVFAGGIVFFSERKILFGIKGDGGK